jgi:hypothetical protein
LMAFQRYIAGTVAAPAVRMPTVSDIEDVTGTAASDLPRGRIDGAVGE